jgi:hypothetical protein
MTYTDYDFHWRYECIGDVDGDRVGYDHVVMEGDREIATAPDAQRAALIAAAPAMFRLLVRLQRGEIQARNEVAGGGLIQRIRAARPSN